MEFEVKEVDLGTRSPTVILNEIDAEELGVHAMDRLQIRQHEGGHQTTGIVEVTSRLVDEGTLGVSRRLSYLSGNETVEVTLSPKPSSVKYIKKKLEDIELDRAEITSVIRDIDENRLNDVELGAYVCGAYTNGMSIEETIHLTEAMTEVGEKIDWDDDVIADKHSIGGVSGNRVTPIIVPVVAAAGVKIPKNSSRAITSPAGTADTVEVLCEVDFGLEEIKEIVEETNGCMVWGGSVNLSPVDDKIIRVENPLSIDPPGQVIASVLSKKESSGSNHVVIDIPYGEGAKVESLEDARELADDFKRVGRHLNIKLDCTITGGSQPIGRGIGPVLEARDLLRVLEGGGPEDLRIKSLRIADILFEISGTDADAHEILDSGKALGKFREIIEAQNGDPDVTTDELKPASQRHAVRADRSGIVKHIDNSLISQIGRRAGAPKDKRAGVYLNKKVGARVEKGDRLFTIYAEKNEKLEHAKYLEETSEVFRIRNKEEALVERV
ncbi:MAG: AMP phosphorylase [Halobacteria archaeon]|nr:AMP phosphorylase [Halobacteria archaeon]